MPDFPIIKHVDPLVISPAIPQSVGEFINTLAQSVAVSNWPTANRAMFYPVSISSHITIVKMFVTNGGTVSGNIDVGIYDRDGVRLVSSGSTAQSGTSAIQEFNVTDTVLSPGLYYLAVALDNNTGQVDMWSINTTLARSFGCLEQTSAFPLPSTATFSNAGNSYRIALVGATQRTVV